MPLPDGFIQELKLKTDIYDVVSTYVTLKKRGSTYVGLCPFHNEKTPSFTVYADTQSFYCFGCGAGGDAVGFVKKIENLDYIDAVKSLAQRAGLQMLDEGFDDTLAKKRRRMYEINRAAARFFHSYMMSEKGKVGLNYFLNRGLSQKTINKFGLGYAPDSWDELLKHLKANGFSVSEMIEAGLVKKSSSNKYYDNFRNRVMTPIIDVRGNVIAFGGRVLDDSKPKYINTSDTLVYKKTNELFALNLAKDSGDDTIILCEGYMDVIAMHQAGFVNAVAGCGTALTNEQVRLISRYAKQVVLAYDADEAGQKALKKAIELFAQTEVKVKIPSLVGGKDPDEIIKKYGRDKFKGMLEGASNQIEFELLSSRKKYNLNATQGKIDFLKDAIKILSNTSPIEQDLYISRLAEELNVEKQSIKAQLDDYIRKNKYRSKKAEYSKIVNDSIRNSAKQSYENSESIKMIKAEERMLGLLLAYPDCYKLCDNFDSTKLTNEFIKKIFNLACERINNGLDTDLTDFGQHLSSSEMGRLSGIIARSNGSVNPKQEFADCIKAIEEESNKTDNASVATMTDDEFRNLFNRNT